MATKTSTRIEFDKEFSGVDVCIGFTRTTVFGRELYGSDADGRRGMMIDTIDEDDYTQVTVEYETNSVKYVYTHGVDQEDALRLGLTISDINEAIEVYMEAHEPVAPEEPEQDFDDQDEDE